MKNWFRPSSATQHMPPATRCRWLNALASMILCVAAANTSAQTEPAARLRSVRVGAGTFNFEQLARAVQEKSYPQGAENAAKVPVGSVSLPAGKELLLIHDETLVRSLLQRAWNARVPPSTAREIEDYDWVAKACSLQ